MKTLNMRETQGSLIKGTNFDNDNFINLIQLAKPFKDGRTFAIHDTINSPFFSNKLFKTLDGAIKYYNELVSFRSIRNKILSKFNR